MCKLASLKKKADDEEYQRQFDSQKEAEQAAAMYTKGQPWVQHVNKEGRNSFFVSDWYDSDTTVSSWVNGEKK